MRIRLIAFATASDVVGRGSTEVELDDDASLSDLRRLLIARHPGLESLWPRLAVAVDGRLAKDDPVLVDGVEVALLPPVSGGAPVAAAEPDVEPVEVAPKAELVPGPIDVAAVERRVAGRACGAVLLFLGTVRDHHKGRRVERLEYSAYEAMAAERLLHIAESLEAEHADAGLRVALVHRLGDVPIGEASVVIAVASAHRDAAYEASRVALERLKREVPIWKREHYEGGEVAWREEEPLVAS